MPKAVDVADKLVAWHEGREPFRPFAELHGIHDLAGAYDVQEAFVRRQCVARNSGAVGYKIGLTSPRMQTMCGIASPIAGVILDADVHSSDAVLPMKRYGRLGIEFEIAVRMGCDLEAGSLPTTIAELAEAVDAVCPAIEVVDDRNADYSRGLDVLSLVADNSWNAGIVLGEFHQHWPDLSSIEAVVERNGEAIDRGTGRDALGHPFEPLLWLARHLAARGQFLRRGDLVLTGSLVPTRFPSAGESYCLRLDGLGSVAIEISA